MTRQSESADAADTTWQPTWAQAMTDFRGEDEEEPFEDVTVRMTVPASIGGSSVRVELSNRFGDGPVLIGRTGIGNDVESAPLTFDGDTSVRIPIGGSLWSEPVALAIRHGDELVVDLYLPELTQYATADGFTFGRSSAGDFVGARDSRMKL